MGARTGFDEAFRREYPAIVRVVAPGPAATTAPDPTPTAADTVPTEPEPGDVATWRVDPADPPAPHDTTVTALVMRTGCAGGQTGNVLRPGVVASGEVLTVTFTVEPLEGDGEATCQGNDEVRYQVDLEEPLGDRRLLDGACGPGGDRPCAPGELQVRWPPPS